MRLLAALRAECARRSQGVVCFPVHDTNLAYGFEHALAAFTSRKDPRNQTCKGLVDHDRRSCLTSLFRCDPDRLQFLV